MSEPISVVLITKNAATQLEKCLQSCAFADEIVVVDSGSSDRTLAIASAYKAKVIHQDWLGFGPQKQFAVDAAICDWVLCVDADERVSESLKESIVNELMDPRANCYEVARCNRFLGRWLRHGEGYPDWSLRLFHRKHARWSMDSVHEKVLAERLPARLKGDLLHDSADTIEKYLDKQNLYPSLQATRMFEAGMSASATSLLMSPMLRFFKFYFLRLGILDGLPGLIHISIGCMNSFIKYAKLIALKKANVPRT